MDLLPKLKHIAVSATGYNIVDTQAAKERGITVSNAPGYGTSAVVQHVFAMILEVSNHIAANAASVAKGKWAKHPDFCFWEYPITEIENKTLGIVGLGAIGSSVAKVAQAFGMKVLVNDRSPEKKQAPSLEFTDVESVFSKADYITLHCPLTDANQGFVNKALIDKMKKNAVLVNTGRGALINENDLAEALKENKIAAACLDVLTQEPPTADNPLIPLKNCYITPHNAWAAKEARERLMDILTENIKGFLAGELKNIVNS
jgi:glycerate dehydrogenase